MVVAAGSDDYSQSRASVKELGKGLADIHRIRQTYYSELGPKDYYFLIGLSSAAGLVYIICLFFFKFQLSSLNHEQKEGSHEHIVNTKQK